MENLNVSEKTTTEQPLTFCQDFYPTHWRHIQTEQNFVFKDVGHIV